MYPPNSAASAYAKVGLETGVIAASPHKLILMLFDGAQLAIRTADRHMREGNIAAKSEAISKALSIISGGLRSALDLKSGGEVAARLDALYGYMCKQLVMANMKNQPELLDEVSRLLAELHDAWKQIGASPSASHPAVRPGETLPSIAA